MEHSQNSKTISGIIVLILILGVIYMLSGGKIRNGVGLPPTGNVNGESAMVLVENTPLVNGVLIAPRGFPSDIPVGDGTLIDSSTTNYPENNTKQLFVSYRSGDSIDQKYSEYKNYMNQAGFRVAEGEVGSSGRTISGTKGSVRLIVTLSNFEGGTLVQLSYLGASAQ